MVDVHLTKRSEQTIFQELQELALSPGYIYAIAQICVRDVFVFYGADGLKGSDLNHLYQDERLIRTEINTLLGLMVRGSIDRTEVSPEELQDYVDKTDRLMKDLHGALGEPMRRRIVDAVKSGSTLSDEEFWRGEALREPIFYGGESAYSVQYRDLSVEKYYADDPWLLREKGFTIAQARSIARSMCALIDTKCTELVKSVAQNNVLLKDLINSFTQVPADIATHSHVPLDAVHCFINAFTLNSNNDSFQSLGDFNAITSTPLIRNPDGSVLLFQHYGILEALYETPYYWMMADKAYRPIAATNRGAFTEQFSAKRLRYVFGDARVKTNVQLVRQKGELSGEIDVLVVFGDRLIVLQAKSKRLTLEARRGNDGALSKDFGAAIQDSYNQGLICAKELSEGTSTLVDDKGVEIRLPYAPKEIFIFNVVSDHYPALALQAKEFLKYENTDLIHAPIVMDVFFLDTLTEMLDSPLRFLSYVQLRVSYSDRIMLGHELTALGFHLKQNLWIEEQYDQAMLHDSVAMDLDAAMAVRREGIPGARTPEGILTRLKGTLFERLLIQIEQRPEPAILQFGLHLLKLGEDTARNIHRGLEYITQQSLNDNTHHDFSIGGKRDSGISFHCNPVVTLDAIDKLEQFCELRKYKQRASEWFGVSVDPHMNLQFGYTAASKWKHSAEMDKATSAMAPMQSANSLKQLAKKIVSKTTSPGRNQLCPCGSGKKFKKCCIYK